ncbi:putative membrane protein [Babesia divergens]|uniref:Membrane protein n=1 Tax=Babesia divergens TaxID=32595 RepID=A0AAD9G6X6_BABDI|nr:putative membrane protein [Babesia divergens]
MSNKIHFPQLKWSQEWQLRLPCKAAKLLSLAQQSHLYQALIRAFNSVRVVWVAVAVSVLFWLYYELGYVAPVCPYYAGKELPPYLNKFKTIGKTYRPSFYMFAPHWQWIYLICFSRLMQVYHWWQYAAAHSTSMILSALYGVGTQVLRLLFRTFLFRKMVCNQAVVSIREFVEAHNGAVVVLDYYLPKWAGNLCSTCGKFNGDVNLGRKSHGPSVNKTDSPVSHMAEEGPDKALRINSTYMETVPFCDTKWKDQMTNSPPNNRGLRREENPSITKDTNAVPHIDSARSSEPEELLDANTLSGRQGTFSENKPVYQADLPPRKVLRGVLVIIGDMSVSYSICNQPMACRCGMPEEKNTECMCAGCTRSLLEDQEGLNIEPPGSPTLRFLIGDALEVGYACVQVHLNVNLGMASEAFPTWTGLRCFPLTLYSDVLLDLDAAIKKVSERYPNLPINCVGVGFGANILMEYLALGSSGKTIITHQDPARYPQKSFGYLPERRSVIGRRGLWPENYANQNWSRDENATDRNARNVPSNHTGSSSFGTVSARGARAMPGEMVGREPSYKSTKPYPQKPKAELDTNDPNYESFCHLNKVMGKVASVNASTAPAAEDTIGNNGIVTLSEEHFNFNEEKEECTYETSVIYPPPPPSEIVLNTKRITTAVCVNLNLRPGGNSLYKYAWHRNIHKRSLYGRHCFASFRHHLVGLLREVHCSRANDSIEKECFHYRCCHYVKVASKQNWIRRMIHRVRIFRKGFDTATRYDSVEQLLLAIHREYRHSYRHMQARASDVYTNYGAGIYKRFGARAPSDFKFSALMTLRYVYTQVDHDNRSPIETLSGPAVYKLVNRRVNTNIRIGKANLYGGINKLLNHASRRLQDPKVYKYIADLINREYTLNVANIRRYMTSIQMPTLLLTSLDNSLCTLEDMDILDVIKNPNLVYYVAKSGTYPSAWFSGPILEFVDEMSCRRVLI